MAVVERHVEGLLWTPPNDRSGAGVRFRTSEELPFNANFS